MFMQSMLKEMHPKSEGGLFDTKKQEEMFYQFSDEAIARDMIKSKQVNLGLGSALKKQYF
jgi:Rod binding domain-containing protein